MMNKVLAFLEKHVQWIALGLGALYLGYMIWLYVVQAPVVVTGVGPTPLSPGEVDKKILEDVTQPLQAAMANTKVPEMTVPNFIEKFKADMGFTDFAMYALNLIPDSPVIPIDVTPGKGPDISTPTDVVTLPVLPPANFGTFSTGKSNVQLFVAGGANGGGNPAAPPQGQPLPGGAAVQPVAGAADKCWVTVSYTIPQAALKQSFSEAKIPAWTEHTTFLEVQLWREEQLPGGKWSNPQQVAPLVALQPLPQAGAPAQQQQDYLTWAIAHVSDILQPAFYQVNKGDPWTPPGQAPVIVQAVLAPLDPTKDYPSSVLEQYSAADKHAYFLAKAKRNSGQPRQNNQPSPSPAPAGGGGSFFNQGRAPASIGTEIDADSFPPNPAQPAPGGAPQPVALPPGADAAATPTPADAAADLAKKFPIPQTGDFDPFSLNQDITGWAHDDTAQPGHTYRYMVIYVIKNPIFLTTAAKANPALNAQFEIKSPPGQWSTPINVASTTEFFVSSNSQPGALNAHIQVFKWQNGVEREHVFEVAPGDIIGGKDSDVDFSTGWTVVDIRFDDPKNQGSMTVLVMNPNGTLERRDYRTDQKKKKPDLPPAVTAANGTDQVAGTAR